MSDPPAERQDAPSRDLELVLLANLKKRRGRTNELLAACGDHWGYEDPVYRFYHQSFKVYALQDQTEAIVRELRALLPERALNQWFQEIVDRGTGKAFTQRSSTCST